MKKALYALFALVLSGCSLVSYRPIEKDGVPLQVVPRREEVRRISAFLCDSTLKEAVDLIPFDLNIVYEGDSYDRQVNVDASDIPVDEYLFAIARSSGVDVERHGTVWVFRSSKETKDKEGLSAMNKMSDASGVASGGFFTAWVDLEGWSQEEVARICNEGSLVWVAGDKYKYYGTLQGSIDIFESVDVMRRASRCMYAFEVVCLTWDLEAKVGIQEQLGMDFNWRSTLSEGMSATEWGLISTVAMNAQASAARNDSAIVVSGVMREGTEYRTTIGDQVPYVKRAVSDSGTVSDVSVEYVDVGVVLSLTVQGASLGICKFSLNQNEVNGYLNGYPIRHQSNVSTVIHVDDESMRYVGSFFKSQKERRLLFMSDKVTNWDVYVKIIRLDRGQKAVKRNGKLTDFEKK